MQTSFLRLFVAFLVVSYAALSPSPSISQEEKTTPAEADASKGEPQNLSGLSLDSLKAKRAEAETSEDLGEAVKKNVLSLLDKAILFVEEKTALEKSTDEIVQRVRAAPERIKEIEAELNRGPPEMQTIETAASQMT